MICASFRADPSYPSLAWGVTNADGTCFEMSTVGVGVI